MRKVLTMLMLIFTVSAFPQQANDSLKGMERLKQDFIKDTIGLLGLRAKHFSYDTKQDVEKIDGDDIRNLLRNKFKDDITKLLGKPNYSYTVNSKRMEDNRIYGDAIENVFEYILCDSSLIHNDGMHFYGVLTNYVRPENNINGRVDEFQIKSKQMPTRKVAILKIVWQVK